MNWLIGVCVGCGCGLLILLLTVAVSVKIHGCIRKRKSRSTTRSDLDPPSEPSRQRGPAETKDDDDGPLPTRDAHGVEMRSYRSGRARGFAMAPFLGFAKRISFTRQNPEQDDDYNYYDAQIPANGDNNGHRGNADHLHRMADHRLDASSTAADNSGMGRRGRNDPFGHVVRPEVQKRNATPLREDDDEGGEEHKWQFNYPNVDSRDSTFSKDYMNPKEFSNKKDQYDRRLPR